MTRLEDVEDPRLVTRPDGSVFQFAYATSNARETAMAWTDLFGIGPWIVRGPFSAPTARYLGEHSPASFTVARSYSAGVMIELIQQHDDHPSVFRATTTGEAPVFHHSAFATQDFEGAFERLQAACGDPVFVDTLPTSARVAFFESSLVLGGLSELVELTPDQSAFYARLRELSDTWDGQDPWRVE